MCPSQTPQPENSPTGTDESFRMEPIRCEISTTYLTPDSMFNNVTCVGSLCGPWCRYGLQNYWGCGGNKLPPGGETVTRSFLIWIWKFHASSNTGLPYGCF
ncbi:hypothetical protein CDAR_268961 [Caerostris darwini]|uniref:Uncharacterized protein n=1 Tax=Caerostris darwini TaxID=1538125 RepID=A0AAV4TI43_9ARAC|nr:hypothetical protein CDAR_268961 [Caerostris darwini]